MTKFSPEMQVLVERIQKNPRAKYSIQHLQSLQTEESSRVLLHLLHTLPSFPAFKSVLDELAARQYIDPLVTLRDILAQPWDKAQFPSRHAAAVQNMPWYQHDPRAFDVLVETLHTTHDQTCERIRALVAYTLHCFDDERTLYVLATTLRYHPEESVRVQAIEALTLTDSPLVFDVLLNFLDDEPADTLTRRTGPFRGSLRQTVWSALNAIKSLWLAGKRPVNSERLLVILEKCLYAEERACPAAQQVLDVLDCAEADSLIAAWKARQSAAAFATPRFFL